MLPPKTPSFFFAEIVGREVGAFVDEILNHRGVAEIRSDDERRDAVIASPVHVRTALDEQPHRREPLLVRAALAVAVDPAIAGSRKQRRLMVAVHDERIGAVIEQ